VVRVPGRWASRSLRVGWPVRIATQVVNAGVWGGHRNGCKGRLGGDAVSAVGCSPWGALYRPECFNTGSCSFFVQMMVP
jgi:hypothetical protein